MDNHRLQQRYPDLFEGQEDPEFYQLVEDLDAAYHAPISPQRSMWSLIQARSRPPHSTKVAASPIQWLATRPSWSARSLGVMAALLAVLIVVGTVYAAISPFLRQVLFSRPATHSLVQNNLFSTISQSRTVAGVTITIEAAYADTNELIIASTIISADGHTILWNENSVPNHNQMSVLRIVVSTKDGAVLGDTDSGKLRVGSSAWQFADKYRGAQAFYVNTDGIIGNPQQLDIQVKMDVGTGAAFRTPKVLGSTTFDFSVPFHSGGIIKLGQKQTTDGETITLQRAVITPSAVRIFISGQQPWEQARMFAAVNVPQESRNYDAQSGSPQDDGSFLFTFSDSLLSGKHGTWTITITEREEHVGGKIRTWIFHFNVP